MANGNCQEAEKTALKFYLMIKTTIIKCVEFIPVLSLDEKFNYTVFLKDFSISYSKLKKKQSKF
jgi:hypothetical protein